MRRYQVNVSAPVLERNRNTGSRDPAIIVRDYKNGGRYMMAEAVKFLDADGTVIAELKGEGTSIWLESDARLELIGAVPGLDQEPVKKK